MRRPKKIRKFRSNYKQVLWYKKVKPHFKWCKCEICFNEFKKEPMFKYKLKFSAYELPTSVRHVCTHCCPTYQHFIDFLAKKRKYCLKAVR